MKNIIISLLLIFGLIFNSCKKTSTEPKTNDDFIFKISVANSNNIPVSGLRVSAWNILPFGNQSTQIMKKILNPPVTKIRVDIAVKSATSLMIFDLKNNLQTVLIDSIMNAGYWVFEWNGTNTAGDELHSGVYKCKLISRDTINSSILFSDSIYMVLWKAPCTACEYLGYTGSKGEYQTNNSLLFPSLYFLPWIPYIDENNNTFANFRFQDSIIIVLNDTSQNRHQEYRRTIHWGVNQFKLTWDPPAVQNKSNVEEYPSVLSSTLAPQEILSLQKQSPIQMDKWSQLIFTDKVGFSQTLYFGPYDPTVNLTQYELPPPPPEGVFNVRYASQRILELAQAKGTSEFPIHISANNYPLTIRWIVRNIPELSAYLNVDNKDYTIKNNGQVLITNTVSTAVLKLTSTSPTPLSFRLFQNYPNPFN
jgi:hypothetical protein